MWFCEFLQCLNQSILARKKKKGKYNALCLCFILVSETPTRINHFHGGDLMHVIKLKTFFIICCHVIRKNQEALIYTDHTVSMF